jgi:hypothetical protein
VIFKTLYAMFEAHVRDCPHGCKDRGQTVVVCQQGRPLYDQARLFADCSATLGRPV